MKLHRTIQDTGSNQFSCSFPSTIARDIQGCEMAPLGPLNGKAFGTSISPWIVTAEALEPFRVTGPDELRIPLAPYLRDIERNQYSIDFTVELIQEKSSDVICRSKAEWLYWSPAQMAAQLTSTGCDLQPGDLIGTGTLSGPTSEDYGCLMEATDNGRSQFRLPSGQSIGYLQDGHTVRISALAGDGTEDTGVGFGECIGTICPAVAFN